MNIKKAIIGTSLLLTSLITVPQVKAEEVFEEGQTNVPWTAACTLFAPHQESVDYICHVSIAPSGRQGVDSEYTLTTVTNEHKVEIVGIFNGEWTYYLYIDNGQLPVIQSDESDSLNQCYFSTKAVQRIRPSIEDYGVCFQIIR